MKFTICEKLLWFLMKKPMREYMQNINSDWNCEEILKKTKKRYIELMSELPEIGSITDNSLRVSLSGGALWLSLYESTPNKMSEEQFGNMCTFTMNSKMLSKVMAAKSPFSKKGQKKKVVRTKKDNEASDSEYSWNTEFIPGRDEYEYYVNYHKCGLCALGKKEGLTNLIPYMCAIDTITIDKMGGKLYRTKTIATGGDYCDFYICKKGSRWHEEKRMK